LQPMNLDRQFSIADAIRLSCFLLLKSRVTLALLSSLTALRPQRLLRSMTANASLRSVSLLEQSRRKRPALANRMRKHPLIPRKRVPAPESEDAYPVSIFGPQHGLTPGQVWEAQRRYNEAVALRGHLKEGWRLAFRMGGLASALLGGGVRCGAGARSQRSGRCG